MNYEELKREISDRSISQLPGLLQHVVRLCAIKPVFKDKAAMMSFVDRVYAAALVSDEFPYPSGDCITDRLRQNRTKVPYEPPGTKFYSQSRKQEMLLVSDGIDHSWAGWLCYRHPDGHWVSLRKATQADRAELDNAIVKAHHQ